MMIKILFLFFLLFLNACSVQRYSHEYYIECEKSNYTFSEINTCAEKKIESNCNASTNCKLENKRFLGSISRIKEMIKSKELSENGAMLQYYLFLEMAEIKKEQLKKKEIEKIKKSKYQNYISGGRFYRCFYVDQIFC